MWSRFFSSNFFWPKKFSIEKKKLTKFWKFSELFRNFKIFIFQIGFSKKKFSKKKLPKKIFGNLFFFETFFVEKQILKMKILKFRKSSENFRNLVNFFYARKNFRSKKFRRKKSRPHIPIRNFPKIPKIILRKFCDEAWCPCEKMCLFFPLIDIFRPSTSKFLCTPWHIPN